jgi:hypothetical protein
MNWKVFILSFVLFSCTQGVKMKSINLGSLFHDNNSKIWVLDKVIVGKENFAPKENKDKDIIVFYENGKCLFHSIKALGEVPGKKGQYSLYSTDRGIRFYFKNEIWEFKIDQLKEDRVVLKPTKDSDLRYTLILRPFPEL